MNICECIALFFIVELFASSTSRQHVLKDSALCDVIKGHWSFSQVTNVTISEMFVPLSEGPTKHQ